MAWIANKSGQGLTLERFPLIFRPPCPLMPLSPSPFQQRQSFQELCSLPSRDVAQNISKVFFESTFTLTFPVLDRALFQETLQVAYENPDEVPSTPSHVMARACVLAALSVTCRFEKSPRDPPAVDGDACAAKARSLLRHVDGHETVVGIETVLILVSKATNCMRILHHRVKT